MEQMTERAAALLNRADQAGLSIAVAESLTGGLVAAHITAVPGASAVFRGGIVAYTPAAKRQLLGVDQERLDRHGPVDAVVAQQMAQGCATALGADVGIATTGVAGPGQADGHPAGTVHVAVVGPAGGAHREFAFVGGREQVRSQTVAAALDMALQVLEFDG